MRTCVSILLVLTAACSANTFDPNEKPDSGDPNPVGGDGGTVSGNGAVYVSSSKGSATGDGTQAHPFASLDMAIAKAGKLPVHACAETYAEQVHFLNGVDVDGSYECGAGWTKSATAHAKIAATASPAAFATNITTATRVEAVDIIAPDFTGQSQSSIGLVANNAPSLTIKNATIHAGTGGKGADGANGITLSDSSTKNGQDGWAAGKCTGSACQFLLHTGSPAGGTNACTGATGHDGGPGGAGGDSGEFMSGFVNSQWAWVVQNNENSTAGFPTTGTAQTTQGGPIGFGAQNGAPGASGSNGSSGTSFGNIVSGVYVTSDGTAGADGAPGQGGGGAGAMSYSTIYGNPSALNYYAWGEPGSAGGAGGCPGLAAGLGKGGGASIAIVAVDGGMTLDTVTITTSNAGSGGSAGTPSAPTSGGLAGKPGQYVPSAGNGGAGGFAGVSGNGGGGPSIGIAYNKVKPTLLASKVTQGAGGAGVALRMVNGTQTIPASDAGMSAETYMFGQ